MKIYGYSKGSKLLTLKEASIEVTLNELDDIISFLNYVRKEHLCRQSDIEDKYPADTPVCSLHLKDWKPQYKHEHSDLIIVTHEAKADT